MKYRLLILLTAPVIAALFLWPRPVAWIGSLPPPHIYPALDPDVQPVVVQIAQLPARSGFRSPKPVVAADAEGNVVVVAHGIATGSRVAIDLLTWRSVDCGMSWGQPDNLTKLATTGEVHFDPWLETDGQGHFYIVHGLFSDGRPLIRRSKDAAKTWSDPLPIQWKDCDRPVLGISPSGKQLVVAGAMGERAANASSQPLNGNDPDLAAKVRASVRYYSGVFVSSNHGDSWEKWTSPFGNEHAIPFAIVVDDNDRVAASWIVEGGGSRSAVSVSVDRGRTWTNSTLVESLQPDRPHPFNGERFPVLALDGDASLHVAYVTAGATRLMALRSRDWKSWENPIQLSHSSAEEVRMAAIGACGPMVHVTWMERIGASWHAYYRGSRNHGESWAPACCLSDAIVHPDSSSANGFQIYGDDDQSSVRDDGLGRVHAVWCIRGGSVVHAVIEWSSKQANAEQLPAPKPAEGPVANGQP